MFNGWLDGLLVGLKTINSILTAGIAITAFSLFLYALSFNLRDRVARSFAIILLCVVVVFTTEALQNKSIPSWGIELLLRLQWVGIIFLPPSYLHLSDALLVTAGRPSRGRRRLAVRLVYVVSLCLFGAAGTGTAGRLLWCPDGEPAPHLQRTVWTEFFTVYYIGIMIWAGYNFVRAFGTDAHPFRSAQDAVSDGRRHRSGARFLSIPFVWFRYRSALSAFLLEHGTYHQPACCRSGYHDGVCGRVLWGFLARSGSEEPPVQMASARTGDRFAGTGRDDDRPPSRMYFGGEPYSAFVPLVMVVTVLLFEHAVTLFSPLWERLLFFGRDRAELQLLQNIEERLLTRGDLQQFLETVLAAVRDHLQSPCAFVAALDGEELILSVWLRGIVHCLKRKTWTKPCKWSITTAKMEEGMNSRGVISGFCLFTSEKPMATVMKSLHCWACLGLRAKQINPWIKISAMLSGCWQTVPLLRWKIASCNSGCSVRWKIFSHKLICSNSCAQREAMIPAPLF